MEISIIQLVAQNRETLVPLLVVLGFLYILKKNENMTQATIDDANQRENDYKELVAKLLAESKIREDKLMKTIDSTIFCQTRAIKELANHILRLSTNVTSIEERVEHIEERLEGQK